MPVIIITNHQRKTAHGRTRFGGWQLDRRARRLTDPSGIPVALTKGEYALGGAAPPETTLRHGMGFHTTSVRQVGLTYGAAASVATD